MKENSKFDTPGNFAGYASASKNIKWPSTYDEKSGTISKVYANTESDITYIKVDFPDMGLYINSITIRNNPKEPGRLWVQMPAFRIGNKWVRPLEFKNDSPFREIILRSALRAFCVYFEVPRTDEDIEKYINDNLP